MKNFQIGEFKTHFSDILNFIKNGEEITLIYGRKKEKVAIIVPFYKYPLSQKRQLGLLKNKASFKLSKDYKISDEDFINL